MGCESVVLSTKVRSIVITLIEPYGIIRGASVVVLVLFR